MSPVGMGRRGEKHPGCEAAQPSPHLPSCSWVASEGSGPMGVAGKGLCGSFHGATSRRRTRLGVFGVGCVVRSWPSGMVFQAGHCCPELCVPCDRE